MEKRCNRAAYIMLAVVAAVFAVMALWQRPAGGGERFPSQPMPDVNAATAAFFASLPSIGEETAENIVAYRRENGDFGDWSELMNVNGVGRSRMEIIEDRLTGGTRALLERLNTAPERELAAVLGKEAARDLAAYRKETGGFTVIEEVTQEGLLTQEQLEALRKH